MRDLLPDCDYIGNTRLVASVAPVCCTINIFRQGTPRIFIVRSALVRTRSGTSSPGGRNK